MCTRARASRPSYSRDATLHRILSRAEIARAGAPARIQPTIPPRNRGTTHLVPLVKETYMMSSTFAHLPVSGITREVRQEHKILFSHIFITYRYQSNFLLFTRETKKISQSFNIIIVASLVEFWHAYHLSLYVVTSCMVLNGDGWFFIVAPIVRSHFVLVIWF